MATLRALCLLTLAMLWAAAPPAAGAHGPAQAGLTVDDRGVFIVFPDRISFNAHVTSSAPVAQIVLEYGVDKRTCGDVTAKAFPDFVPGPSIDVSWTWEMLQTGSEPPGAVIWYRWRVTDSAGNSVVTPEQRVTWIDTAYPWQQISRDGLTLHWYDGEPAFAEDLLGTTVEGIGQLAAFTGVRPQSPIDLYIYANTEQMQQAILYEPSWTGGVAYPANNITIIGISPAYLDWGKRTIVHELTHLIVGQLTFSCGENVPTWLDEGIAVYAEGGLDPRSQQAFDSAIAGDSLLSVRAISNGFSQHPDIADLSYSQSYSLVRYLASSYGPDKLLALFGNLRAGQTVEAGLQGAYGFDLNGLEDRWRAWLGAAPRAQAAPTATPPPTPIPTVPLIAVAPTGPAVPPTPTSPPTLEPTAPPAAPAAGGQAEAASVPPPAARASLAPRLSIAAAIFLLGLGLAGLASWKLLGGR